MTRTISARAILFDMDGTLVDSHPVVERIWAEFARRFDLDVAEILATSHGVRMVETARKYAPHGTDIDAVVADLSRIEYDDTEGVTAIAGARDLLDSLPHGSWALVTSAARPLTEKRMAGVGLPIPAVIVTSEVVTKGKPDPEPYLRAAEQLGVAASDCLVFEDAEAGIRAGVASGAQVVVVGDAPSETADRLGLPRIPDHTALRVEHADGGLHVQLP
ncbi:glycerol-3-phosphatase [Agromyces rhizosphaerae]|uniref:Glycerol-3-phosphatase n=1 Tax=Agromyces rhizosphaerae TaxID=88374 RepID=A0A9W6CVM7_9MICO|nr:HAD-IA family hydrolase [Agromyces rhizosphaerae]GLI27205.1 glycerol-3-phosphatase [Agromyces rhizosphaerae]